VVFGHRLLTLNVAGHLPSQLFIIGAGSGAVLQSPELAGPSTRVVVLEPDAVVAARMVARPDWARWINDGRLRVLAGPDYHGASSAARQVDVSESPRVVVSRELAENHPAAAAAARAVAMRMISEAEANANARKRFAGRYLLQTIANLAVIAREGNITALDGRFAGRPAVVVGAGPSLDENLPALAALQDRAVIIGADTTLRPLLAGGVRPHIMAAVDPAELNARHLAGVSGLDDVWLAAEGSLHPAAFGGFAGRTFLFKVSDHEPWPWLNAVGLDCGLLRAWGSVVTSAFDLALRMGCSPIVFAGLDLSYPVRRPYCANTFFDETWHAAIATHGCTWEQLIDDYFNRLPDLRTADIHGTPTLTSSHLVSFRDWLREQIGDDASGRFVNATGAGILHGPGLVQSSLHEALGNAPSIDRDVREQLRVAHAGSLRTASRLRRAAEDLLAHPDLPRSAGTLARWVDFSAGSLTVAGIRDQLAATIPSLGVGLPTPATGQISIKPA